MTTSRKQTLVVTAAMTSNTVATVQCCNIPSKFSPEHNPITIEVDFESYATLFEGADDSVLLAAAEITAVRYLVIGYGYWPGIHDKSRNLPDNGRDMVFKFAHFEHVSNAHNYIVQCLETGKPFDRNIPLATIATVFSCRLDKCNIQAIDMDTTSIIQSIEFPEPLKNTIYTRSRTEELMQNTPFGDIYITYHTLLSFSNATMNSAGERGQRARTPFQKLRSKFDNFKFVPADNLHKLKFLTEKQKERGEVFNVEVWKQANNGFHYVLSERETTLYNQPTKLFLDEVVALSYENIERAAARYESSI